MKAAIHNPYWDTLGGGERYTCAFATALLKNGYKVDISWKDTGIIKKLERRFGIDLSGVNIVDSIERGDGYDVCFWVSDGSIPLLKSRNNILHFQFPFKDLDAKTLMNKMKFFRIKKVVCNSEFTKTFIDKTYGIDSVVVYPPVDVDNMSPKRKENVICYVGRFSKLTQKKGQDVLVDSFKKLYDGGYKKWKLVLAGGAEVGVDKYIDELKNLSSGYPISFLISPPFEKIVSLFGKSKIFWSASGYGVNEAKRPKQVEHFGITVVEAMASGAVPFIFDAGGHREIVTGENGYLWKSKEDLINKTEELIENVDKMKKLSKKALSDSKKYGYQRFEKEVLDLL